VIRCDGDTWPREDMRPPDASAQLRFISASSDADGTVRRSGWRDAIHGCLCGCEYVAIGDVHDHEPQRPPT
jgi:hypothetical protein